MGYSLSAYHQMSWREYYYACELYAHRRDLAFEQSRLIISWIVSHSMGVKKAIQPDQVITLRSLDKPKKTTPLPTKQEREKIESEGAYILEQIQKQLGSKFLN